MKEAIGICLGASTISIVQIYLDNQGNIHINGSKSELHNGNPKETFLQLIKSFDPVGKKVVVTGRKFRNLINLTSISEPEATEKAFEFMGYDSQNFSAIASLGGETFVVYTLDTEGKISNIISKNQCASGTGEFYLQQIKRMDISLEESIEISKDVTPFKVSGRCSVFCKSDCTHALNKGTPKSEVTAGLALMIADKIEELLKKSNGSKFLLVGGLTQNTRIMDFLKVKVPNIHIPEYAQCFEALGAAIFAMENDCPNFESFDNIFNYRESSFVFHRPLSEFVDKVVFKEMERGIAESGDECILGLDVGSTTTKAVVMRTSDNKILASVYLYTNGNPIKAARECYSKLLEQLPSDIKIIGLGTTGSGRHIAGLHALTEGIFNEIIAHATAAVYFDPEVDTIFEIGGQDAKYTYIVNKVPADYAMNEACSAGTGSFIEESAYESLRVKVNEIEKMAMQAKRPPNFSDQCSAFISSDIKTAQQENISKEDIVAGLVYSICLNYVNRVKGNRQVGKKIFMQGGVCYNKAIPIAMSALTEREIIVPPEPGLMGAYGVALEVKEKIQMGFIKPKLFSLSELAQREVIYRKPFICKGGKEQCDRKCVINMIEVQGQKYPFGGACNKYYNLINKRKIEAINYDYVAKRQRLMFGKYAPVKDLQENAKTIGMNLSFHTFTLYPLFYNFFTELGLNVVLPDEVDEEGIEREMTAMCYPAQLSHGLFKNLIDKNPDYFFIPNLLEMFVDEGVYQRLDNNCSCIFVSGEPYYLKQAFKDYNIEDRIISPIFNFGNGYDKCYDLFVECAQKVGIRDEGKIKQAYEIALKMQEEYQEELFTMGREFLQKLDSEPNSYAIVLVGRPYNSFTDIANKGIPQKIASRGVYVIPYDMLDYRRETLDSEMYWEGGKKILKVAKIIKRHPRLFATYVSNFSCAPDSMIIPMFRSIMGRKPSLTLELDGHTADAGINTRIDAVIDIINNYLKISKELKISRNGQFKPAKIEFGKEEAFFISSDGERLPLSDPRVEILLPSMGDLAVRLFAAGMRSQGFNAIALPDSNPEILKIGRANATGKECLPLLLCSGLMLDYIQNKWNKKSYLAFFIVQGAGNCRLGYYPTFMKNIIKEKQIPNVATMELMHEDGFAGLGPNFAARGIETLIASDVLDDIRSAIMANAIDPDKGLEIFNEEFDKLIDVTANDYKNFYKALKNLAITIRAKVPAKIPISESKYIALLGEMYVRRDGFAHKWLNKVFAKKGFVVKDAYVSEWIYYVDYLLINGLYEPLKSFKNKWERLVRYTYMRIAEYRIKKILEKSGYYQYTKTRVAPLVKHGKHIVPLEFKGEPLLIVGTGLNDTLEKYCGIISVGPFGCMQTRFAEAVTVPEMKVENKIKAKRMYNPNYQISNVFSKNMSIPFLAIETDGNVYPQIIEARLETFALQAKRTAELMKLAKNGKYNKFN